MRFKTLTAAAACTAMLSGGVVVPAQAAVDVTQEKGICVIKLTGDDAQEWNDKIRQELDAAEKSYQSWQTAREELITAGVVSQKDFEAYTNYTNKDEAQLKDSEIKERNLIKEKVVNFYTEAKNEDPAAAATKVLTFQSKPIDSHIASTLSTDKYRVIVSHSTLDSLVISENDKRGADVKGASECYASFDRQKQDGHQLSASVKKPGSQGSADTNGTDDFGKKFSESSEKLKQSLSSQKKSAATDSADTSTGADNKAPGATDKPKDNQDGSSKVNLNINVNQKDGNGLSSDAPKLLALGAGLAVIAAVIGWANGSLHHIIPGLPPAPVLFPR